MSFLESWRIVLPFLCRCWRHALSDPRSAAAWARKILEIDVVWRPALAVAVLFGCAFAVERLTRKAPAARRVLKASVLILAGAGVWLFFDANLQRRLVLAWGTPCEALVEGVGTRSGRYANGRYATINFSYAPAEAMTASIEIGGAALDSLYDGKKVKVHYLRFFPPVLDEDFGSAKEVSFYYLIPLLIVATYAAGSIHAAKEEADALKRSAPADEAAAAEYWVEAERTRRRRREAFELRMTVVRIAVLFFPLFMSLLRRLGLVR